MLKIKIFIPLLLLAYVAKSQFSAKPAIDTTSKAVATLFNQKKYTTALSIVNKLIVNNPSDGINYFNRAVINLYKNGKYDSYDTSIITDCVKAKETGYGNSELYYLLFCQFFNYSNSHEKASYFDISEDYFVATDYHEQKRLIDTTIEVAGRKEKYLWARIQLFVETKIASIFIYPVFKEFEKDIPVLKKDCESVIGITKNLKTKSLAYYYLSETYKIYYSDSLKAIQCLSAAIDLDPKNNDAYAERGKLRAYFNNDQDGAISDFSIYLSRWQYADISYERALCYSIIGKLDNALSDLNESIPLFEETRKNILSSEDGFRILEYHQPKWGAAYNLRGLVKWELGNKEGSLKDFNKAIEYGSEMAITNKNELLDSYIQSKVNVENSNISNNSVQMTKKGGVYEIPITINNTLKINFIFDAGASDVSISADVALTLIRTGTVTDKDFIGTQTYKFADGSVAKSKVFLLKELQIGTRKINKVRATISNSLEAPLLLGQSALNRFGKITIDYKNGVIHFED